MKIWRSRLNMVTQSLLSLTDCLVLVARGPMSKKEKKLFKKQSTLSTRITLNRRCTS
jgi:hypothetical protein